MCDVLASVCHSAWAASLAPRYSPGCQPWDRRIFWPKESVLRDHLVLFGSLPSLRLLFSGLGYGCG